MSSKTPKRKRAAAPVAAEPTPPAPAPVEPVAIVESAPAVEAAAPVADAMDQADHGPTVSLASNHTIKDAAALQDSLLQVFDEPGAVAVDAKSVERIDTAVMQLLCAFVRDRAARGHAVSFSRPTQAFLDAAQLLGVSTLLALPAVDAGVAK